MLVLGQFGRRDSWSCLSIRRSQRYEVRSSPASLQRRMSAAGAWAQHHFWWLSSVAELVQSVESAVAAALVAIARALKSRVTLVLDWAWPPHQGTARPIPQTDEGPRCRAAYNNALEEDNHATLDRFIVAVGLCAAPASSVHHAAGPSCKWEPGTSSGLAMRRKTNASRRRRWTSPPAPQPLRLMYWHCREFCDGQGRDRAPTQPATRPRSWAAERRRRTLGVRTLREAPWRMCP